MQHGGDASLHHQLIGDPFKGFTVDRVAVGLRLLDRCTGGFGALFIRSHALAINGLIMAIPGKAFHANRCDIAAKATESL